MKNDLYTMVDQLGKVVVIIAGVAALFPIAQYYREGDQRRADTLVRIIQTLEMCEQVWERFEDDFDLWFNGTKEYLVSSRACDELRRTAIHDGNEYVSEHRKRKTDWCQTMWREEGPAIRESSSEFRNHCFVNGDYVTGVEFHND